MKELVEDIAKALVDSPEGVSVHAVEGEQVTVLELRVAPGDLGKVIGKQGRTARSIRTILGAAGMKLNRRFTLAILSRVWGTRGEFAAIPLSDHPERFEQLGRVFLFGAGPSGEFEVEAARWASGSLLLKFRGVDSISDAEPWRGAEVRIPRSERLALED